MANPSWSPSFLPVPVQAPTHDPWPLEGRLLLLFKCTIYVFCIVYLSYLSTNNSPRILNENIFHQFLLSVSWAPPHLFEAKSTSFQSTITFPLSFGVPLPLVKWTQHLFYLPLCLSMCPFSLTSNQQRVPWNVYQNPTLCLQANPHLSAGKTRGAESI